MMQTLAHELRHPVTSLRLSLEAYRNIYDLLPSSGQEEFLRMTGQVQRLFRIIQASGQYLTAETNNGRPFQFKPVAISSIQEFVFDLLTDYQKKITIEFEGKDGSFNTDPYWLSVCILNLVKNALIHGAPPVEVRARLNQYELKVEVRDHGARPINSSDLFQAFHKDQNSEGMGLGLVIVARIIQMMGGQIRVHVNPTCFEFTVKELSDAKAAAG
jgi:signal transduction histidine kinase